MTVSGRSTSNSPLASTLSLLSTSYLNGHFASPSAANVSTLNPPARPYAVNPLLQTPFVVPGRALGVFPISLVFVGAWTLFLLLVVGLGSVARWRERTGHRSTLRRNHQVELRTLHLVNRLGQ